MSSQSFNFSGTANQSAASITVNAGEHVRVRVASAAGFPSLFLSVTQNGVTDTHAFKCDAGGVVDFASCVAGDVIAITYTGQTASDAISGVLESMPAQQAGPAPWATPGTAFDARGFASVTIACTVAPSVAYTPQWSPDGVTWSNDSAIDGNFGIDTSIGAIGKFDLPGGGYVRLTGGTGGTFFISGGQ